MAEPRAIIGDRDTDPAFDPAYPWGENVRVDGMTVPMLVAAQAIIATFGNEDDEWSFMHCRDGHCGPGMYLATDDDDDDGSYFVGRSSSEQREWNEAKAQARRGLKQGAFQ